MNNYQKNAQQNAQLRTSSRRRFLNRNYQKELMIKNQDLKSIPGKPWRYQRNSYWWERALVYTILLGGALLVYTFFYYL